MFVAVLSVSMLVGCPPTPFILTVENDGHGTTDPSGAVPVTAGAAQSIKAAADSDYHFSDWTQTKGAGIATFDDVHSAITTVTVKGGDVTIKANFSINTYKLTLQNDINGTTEPAGMVTVGAGVPQPISASANVNVHFVNWTQTGGPGTVRFGDPNSSTTTVAVTGGDAAIQANFTSNPYTLTVQNDGHATTDPSGTVTVTAGAPISISATPSAAYHFVIWTVVSGSGVTFGSTGGSSSTTSTDTVTLTSGDAIILANTAANPTTWVEHTSGYQCGDLVYQSLSEAITDLENHGISVYQSKTVQYAVAAVCGAPTGLYYQALIDNANVENAGSIGWNPVTQ